MLNNKPAFRKLRGYAFDPITSLDLDTAEINQIVYKVPWEEHLQPGPEGESIKVIDRDPASNATYKPVDLNDFVLLASDGLTPSETNPQFHQQMVYAVVMSTITNFEKALGRKVMWSPVQKKIKKKWTLDYVDKLLVYPHALRDQNAYYSPDRKALLFGYYNATPSNAGLYLPGGIVYACLSHDIVAHETTHALLDGMYSRFMESTHPDVPAFHEGFADLVALLQHFMYPEIVRSQIKKVRGEMDAESLLGKLAVEFGQSTGGYSALRDAIGENTNGIWKRKVPNVTDYDTVLECHERGALLVSCVFDAYIAIYKNRTADLLRIATGGTGVLPTGEIHPDLVKRLADEAAKTASHVLNMCVRALDYCPPVDIHYGDYLRALITADKELVANDEQNYRISFINAFRKHGIFPEGVPNLSVETLCYNELDNETPKKWFNAQVADFLRAFKEKLAYETNREKIFYNTQDFIRGNKEKNIKGLHSYLFDPTNEKWSRFMLENLTGLVFTDQFSLLGISRSRTYNQKPIPSIEIHSLRIHNRTGPDGNLQNQIIMTLAQRCRVTAKPNADGGVDFFPAASGVPKKGEERFIFRGGCTMIFDLNTLTLKHIISKPIFDTSDLDKGSRRKLKLNQSRMQMQYNCLYGSMVDQMGFAPGYHTHPEPFAFIHQSNQYNNEW
jgi:hypothetical protein